MAEHSQNPETKLQERFRQSEEWLRRTKDVERWRRRYCSLNDPEKALQLEKDSLNIKIQRIKANARIYVQRPELLARLERDLDQLAYYAGRLRALEPDCGCKDKERRETYNQELKECLQECPLPEFTLEDVFPPLPRSPTPSLGLLPSGRVRTQPSSDGPTDSPRDNPLSTPASRHLSVSLTLHGAERDVTQALELDHDEIRVEYAPGEASGSSSPRNDTTVVGDSTATGDAATTAGHEQVRASW